jgi:oxalate decarboxylase/phosphoglucose isomerase-like protein (cupin superfamily)
MAAPRQLNLEGIQRNDERGWALNPLQAAGLAAGGPVGNLHAVSVRPGTARGNHCHADATEWMLVFGGPGRFIWRSPASPTPQEIPVESADPVLFEIPPGVEHALVNTSGADIFLLAFYNVAEPATVPCGPLTAQRQKT